MALKNEYGERLQIPSLDLVEMNAIGRGVTAEISLELTSAFNPGDQAQAVSTAELAYTEPSYKELPFT